MHYRALERKLYELGEPPDAQPARPRLRVLTSERPRPGPRGPFRENLPRLELSLATRRLSDDEMRVIREHYLLRVRSLPRRQRAPVLEHLMSLMR